jgi:hypothetical protein
MEMKDFVKKVTTKFESPVFDCDAQECVAKNWEELEKIKNELVATCVKLDAIKREIYYREQGRTDLYATGHVDKKEYRVLHAAIGLTTESIEFMEGVVNAISEGKPIDDVHLIEEAGDTMFYLGIAADVLNSSFEQIAEANSGENGKLEIRYQKKFSKDRALGRDLAAERAALEAATKNINTNVIGFPAPEEMYWEENIKAKYMKFGAVIIIVTLGFFAAMIGPMFLSRLF